MAVKIFFCYAHQDKRMLDKLKSHLRSLQRNGFIDTWDDGDINAGTEWELEVNKHLNEAQVILLLVSPAFMNSDYCYSIEMKRAIERHERGEVRVIPVILRPVLWNVEPLNKLLALPMDGKPIVDWPTLDHGYKDVVKGIHNVIQQMLTDDRLSQSRHQPTLTSERSSSQNIIIYQNYCNTCKNNTQMKNTQMITMKNGLPAVKGICSICGTNMHRQLKSNKIIKNTFTNLNDFNSDNSNIQLNNTSAINAKKEIDTTIAKIREDVRNENRAWLLLDKAHDANDLFQAETLVKQAAELWPPIRLHEYRQLGVRNAKAIIDGFPLEYSDEYRQAYRIYTKDTLAPFLSNALSYLEETVLYAEYPNAEGLLYLACMYGYQRQFSKMTAIIDKALKVDESIKEEFRQSGKLEFLLRPCRSDRSKIESVVKKLKILPVTKEIFCNFITDFDLKDFNGYIKWLAVKKSDMPGEKGVHTIHICPPYIQNGELVCAHSKVFETGQVEGITISPQFVTIEALYDKLCRLFILISPINR